MMLRQMQYFHAVVRTGSFTAAAEECFISQSAISQQIKALENDLGVKLLVRENRSFHLTKAGEYLYQHAGTYSKWQPRGTLSFVKQQSA